MQKDLPEIRFSEFEDVWEMTKLGDVIIRIQSGVSRKLFDADVGLPILRSNNIQNGKLDISDIKYWYSIDDQGVNLENYFLKENDVLVNFINSLAQIGKVALYENLLKRDTIFTTNLLRISLKSNVDTRFVFYNFTLKSYQDYIQSITKPAVNQASFTTKDFQKYLFHLPTLPEQQKIASFLTSVDTRLTQLKHKKNLLEQYKKGVIQKIFSREIRFKDEEGKEFPEWEENRLDKIILRFIVPMRDKPKELKGDIPWCRIEDFNGKYLSHSKSGQGVTIETVKKMNLKVYPPNTLLVSCSANLGFCAIVKRELVTNQTFIGLVPNESNVNVEFLYYVMILSSRKLNTLSSGTTISYLSREQFEKFDIILPCLPEQTKIANFLSSLDEKINHCNTQIEKTEQWKKGLIQQMFC